MNNIVKLPGGNVLIKGEELISKDSFMSSLTTFYIKSSFATTNKRFIAHYPKTILGFIPLGFNNMTFSLKKISGVQVSTSYKILRIIIGIITGIVGLVQFNNNFGLGLLLLLLGILIFASGIQAYIKVASSGGIAECPILFWEKGKAQKVVNKLNNTIAENS